MAGNMIIHLPISVKFLRIKESNTWRLKIRIRIKLEIRFVYLGKDNSLNSEEETEMMLSLKEKF